MRAIDCEQYTPEWWRVRRGKPTASTAKQIITPTGRFSKSAINLADSLIADEYDPDYFERNEDYQTAAMKNGHLLEPEVRSFYEFSTGNHVHRVGFIVSDDERAGCSPDGLVGDEGVLEIKSPTHKTHVGYLLSGDLPPEYKPQVHWHLLVTGRAWCDFISYARNMEPLIVRVTPDDYTKQMAECAEQFFALLDERRSAVQLMHTTPDSFTAYKADLSVCQYEDAILDF